MRRPQIYFLAICSWLAVLSTAPTAVFAVNGEDTRGSSAFNWEISDRLPINKIQSIIQTHDGYLWLGTVEGLDRYDGINLKSYNKASVPELPCNLISCLYEDREDELWIGSESGELLRMVGGKFESVTLPREWSAAAIEQILQDKHGVVWVLNHSGEIILIQKHDTVALRLPGGKANRQASGPGAATLVRDADGVVWLCEGAMLREMTPDGKTPATIKIPAATGASVIFMARAGGFWVLDGDHLQRLENGKWADDRGAHNVSSVVPAQAIEVGSGDIFMAGGRNELSIISDAGEERRLQIADSPDNDSILCLYNDREGNIWVGTAAGGLKVIRPRVVTMVEPPDHWLGRPVVSVTSSRPGELFVGTQKASVYHYANGVFTGMSQLSEPAASAVQSLCADAGKAVWIGTSGDGLWRETQDGVEQIGSGPESPQQVNALFQSSAGDIWQGTEAGPILVRDGRLIPLAGEFPAAREDVRCFAEGPDGAIWVGTQGHGLGRLLNGRWTQFSRQDGLAGETVWSLLADKDGSIWIGTYGSGIFLYQAGRFSAVTSRNGLPSDVICSMVDDQNGCLWMSSFAGIFRVGKEALRRCAEGQSQQVSCQVFGFAEGLPTVEFAGGNQPNACRSSDGRLWFACGKGLAMIDPDAARYNALPPLVALEEILIDGEAVDLGSLLARKKPAETASFEIEPGRRHVEMRYAGLSFNSPGRVQFRYRMQGLEKEWVEVGDRRSVYFSYLPAGQYVFEVSACNNGGAWSDAGVPLKLIVRPYFWQTWWFMAGAASAGMAGVALVSTGISRKRELRKRQEMERQRARDAERTRIARDIHDQLGVGLTRISMLSVAPNSRASQAQTARENIEEIHQTTTELTRSMDEIVWAVNPRHDTLDSLLTYLGEFARNFLKTAEVRCRLDLPLVVPPVHLSPEVRHHVFLAFQESLNNVVKHAAATEVRMVADLRPAELHLSIEDNGKGFDYAGIRVKESAGNGLKNMETRLRDIGGWFVCESKAGGGAKVRLIIPIQK